MLTVSIDKRERGEWKTGLKLNIKKTQIMVSGPITSLQLDGETMEIVTNLGSKSLQIVTAAIKKKKDAYPLEEKLWPT